MSSSESSGGDSAPLQSAAWIDDGAGEARVGEARLVRGGAKVSTVTEDAPADGAPPPGPDRVLGEAEIAESGLLRDRVIEIGEMREEAVVSKQAVVREELVVRRDVEERTERIADTLRRTEIDVERLEPEGIVHGESAGDAPGR